jgi:hypothetical protein
MALQKKLGKVMLEDVNRIVTSLVDVFNLGVLQARRLAYG